MGNFFSYFFISENFYDNTSEHRLFLNGYTSHSKYRYDLILFPRILELCLSFILTFKQEHELVDLEKVESKEDIQKFEIKYNKFNTIVEMFLKRLLYLLESCNFNIHILINNVS
jgi:hypothetical protein